MYAVIRTGGKQVRVAEGDVVRVERLTKETLEKGAEVSLTEVLAIGKDDGLHPRLPARFGRDGHGSRRARDARAEAPRLQEEAPEGLPAHPRTPPGSRRDPHRVHYRLIGRRDEETKTKWHTKKVRVRPATGATATASASA